MEFIASLDIPASAFPLDYKSRVLLTGSCFTEHIGAQLQQHKFFTLANPTGIVFDALSVARHLQLFAAGTPVSAADFFQHHGTWNHWNFHSDFSHTDREQAVQHLNETIAGAHQFLQTATHLIITIGTAWYYRHNETGIAVANCHKVPQTAFTKTLCPVAEMTATLQAALDAAVALNPQLKIIFTVSPVRHLRDGMIENNRSKGRVLDAVHTLCETNASCVYFPAYELVTDVLRDYRWYAADFAHPTMQAAQYVFERFTSAYMHHSTQELMKQVMQVTTAMQHRPRFAETAAHAQFKKQLLEKVQELATRLPSLDWNNELTYFST
jgi:hypothetical protein